MGNKEPIKEPIIPPIASRTSHYLRVIETINNSTSGTTQKITAALEHK